MKHYLKFLIIRQLFYIKKIMFIFMSKINMLKMQDGLFGHNYRIAKIYIYYPSL